MSTSYENRSNDNLPFWSISKFSYPTGEDCARRSVASFPTGSTTGHSPEALGKEQAMTPA